MQKRPGVKALTRSETLPPSRLSSLEMDFSQGMHAGLPVAGEPKTTLSPSVPIRVGYCWRIPVKPPAARTTTPVSPRASHTIGTPIPRDFPVANLGCKTSDLCDVFCDRRTEVLTRKALCLPSNSFKWPLVPRLLGLPQMRKPRPSVAWALSFQRGGAGALS
jgi:hypothetical protein